MVDPKICFETLKDCGINFFTGVPDSSLKNLTAFITDNTESEQHIIAANEGASIGLALGHFLATGNPGFVYMQNSGLGNAVNPLLSLADEKVYAVPMLLMIGWRGEPGKKDEPQHIKQGEVSTTMLEAMQIPFDILNDDETIAKNQIEAAIETSVRESKPFVLLARPSIFAPYKLQKTLQNNYSLSRESALKIVVDYLQTDDVVVSTTGKLSRELYEYRDELKQEHHADFLTVGGMGHASSIALGIALQKKNRKVFCLDGDGALLMHAGALSNIGNLAPENYIHLLFNNGAHESVGGQPTLGFDVDFQGIAKAFRYKNTYLACDATGLKTILREIKEEAGPILLEIKVGIASRKDLGRPATSPKANKTQFMKNLMR